MIQYSFSFVLLNISTVLVLLTGVLILRARNKSQIHYTFLGYMLFLTFWNVGLLLDTYSQNAFAYKSEVLQYITHIGTFFSPVLFLLTGMIFAHTRIKFSLKQLLLFIMPIISLIILMTNKYHQLFYLRYSLNLSEIVYGKYFVIHTLYSYLCVLIGLYYLVYFSVKNNGFFSRQSIIIFTGSMIPFAINILATFKIVSMTMYSTPITFSIAVIFYEFAIFKFHFLNIAPIALQHVVDRISDSFIVVNGELIVIDYNKTFVNTFGSFLKIRRNMDLKSVFSSNSLEVIDPNALVDFINNARENKESFTFETNFSINDSDKYYAIEVTPIIAQDIFIGTIILLKDITTSKRELQSIKEKQTILMQERLVSMGQLIGGIAHNLKTPIMSISGGLEALKDLVREYDESIGDSNVTEQDHHEIAQEMMEWLEKIKPYCSYMSDIITTVKGQAMQLNASSTDSFTLDELVKRIDMLMKQELKKNGCKLNIVFQADRNIELKGDINNLVQVFDNLIINAIQSYEGKSGNIDFIIKKAGENVEFVLKDYGRGIRADIKDKLFKQMITTKGKNGTGLGLYISYSNINGRFGGNMWFETEEDKGTSFYVSIPSVQPDTQNPTYREAVH